MMNKMTFLPIESYVLHRSPMLLIDELLMFKNKSISACYNVKKDNIFLEAEGLPSWVGIEIMAQTIALYSGIKARQANKELQTGFLLGARHMQMQHLYYSVGTKLVSYIEEIIVSDNGLGQFDGKIFIEDKLVSQAVVNVFEPAAGE